MVFQMIESKHINVNTAVWVILPLKHISEAKTRLSSVLSIQERRCFFQCMVEDVLDCLYKHSAITQTIVVSKDPDAQRLAERYGMKYWSESSLQANDLNSAVNHAAEKLTKQGLENMLVVHADLPLMCVNQLQTMIEQHLASDAPVVTIAPDSHKQGSNCVMCTPPNALAFHYGENSFEKHQTLADKQGIGFKVIHLDSIALDIDNPNDLYSLLSTSLNRHSIHYLVNSGIAQRLESTPIPSAFSKNSIPLNSEPPQ